MKKLSLLLILIACAIGQEKCAHAQCNIATGASVGTIQTAINSAANNSCAGPVTNETLFAASGAWTINSQITIPCPGSAGLIIQGVQPAGVGTTWPITPTAILTGTLTNQAAFRGTACSNPVTIRYLQFNGGNPAGGGGGFLYVPAGMNNLTVTYNWLYGNSAVQTASNIADAFIWMDGSSVVGSTRTRNTNISWNRFGRTGSSDCANLMNVLGGPVDPGSYAGGLRCSQSGGLTYPVAGHGNVPAGYGGSGSAICLYQDGDTEKNVGGYCTAVGVHVNTDNLTLSNNSIQTQEQGFKFFEGCSNFPCPDVYKPTNVTVTNNDFAGIHRIYFEAQHGGPGPWTLTGNSFHDGILLGGVSWGWSLPQNGTSTFGNSNTQFLKNNLILQNINPQGTTDKSGFGASRAYGVEWWTVTGNADNNLIQGYWGGGVAWGFGGPSWTVSHNIFQQLPNVFENYISQEESQTSGPAQVGNTFSHTVGAFTSHAPTISPAPGVQSFPLTVTLTDTGDTSGLGPQGNTGIWYTTDGSTPVPGAGTAKRLDGGGSFTLASAATVKAVGMWGALNQPTSYASGYGFVPSSVVSAAYTGSAPINAASCSASDVQAALNSVTATTTQVNIPAGTCHWTTQVTHTVPSGSSSLLIAGAGNLTTPGGGDATNIIDDVPNSNPILVINASSTGSLLRVAGVTFKGGAAGAGHDKFSGLIQVSGTTGNFRFDHSHLDVSTYSPALASAGMRLTGCLYGVADDNIWDTSAGSVNNAIQEDNQGSCYGDTLGVGDQAWSHPTNLGSANFFYLENNIFNGGVGNDCTFGGSYVFRFNTFNMKTPAPSVQTHPTGGAGRIRGCRAWEIYQNTFTANPSNYIDSLFFMSSGTGVFWGNTVNSSPAGGGTGFKQMISAHSMRTDNSTYPQTGTPNGWGYCGTNFNGTGSNWDQNSNSATGYHCLDQPGRGQGDLLTGGFSSDGSGSNNVTNNATGCTAGSACAYPRQALEPIYQWLDQYNPVPSNPSFVWNNSTANAFTQNVDYYLYTQTWNGSAFTGTAFNGTVGTGSGTLAARPATCTTGVAYWATDQGNWNLSGSGGQGVLYKCTATNTWSTAYTPYTYPHPLIGGGTPPAANAPTFTPSAGTYGGTQNVTISSTTPGASITYCTGSGCTPTTPYTGPVTVSTSQFIGAFATASGFVQSATVYAAYTINPPPTLTGGFQGNGAGSPGTGINTITVGSPATQQIAFGTYSDGSTHALPFGTDTAVWTSSNSGVLTVTSGGLVSGASAGTANSQVHSAPGNVGFSPWTWTVNATPPTFLSAYLTGTNSLVVGSTSQLVAKCHYSSGADQDCTVTDIYGHAVSAWNTSDATKATVSSGGLVTAVAAGTPSITALVNPGSVTSAAYPITITNPAVSLTGVSLSTAGGVTGLFVGATNQLKATCTYSDGSSDDCTTTDAHGNLAHSFVSTAPAHATVNATTGLVTGVAPGSTTFTVVAGSFTSNPLPVAVFPVISGIYTIILNGPVKFSGTVRF